MKITVYGVAATKGSSRAFPRRSGGVSVVPDNRPSLKAWEERVRAAGQDVAADRDGQLMLGPLKAVATWLLPRPRGHYGTRGLLASAPAHPVKKPDLDKLARAIFDALKGVWYADDSQLIDIEIHKRFAEAGVAPRLDLEVDWI